MSVFDYAIAPFAVVGVIAIAAVVIAWRNWQRYGTGAT